MKIKIQTHPFIVVLLFLCASVFLTAQTAPLLHGSLDIFSAEGIELAWAITKSSQGQDPEKDVVSLRIVRKDKKIGALTVLGVDPFTGNQNSVFKAAFSDRFLEIQFPRSHFADYPKTEIYFFSSSEEEKKNAPSFIVYYMGVPDTTPEFLDEEKMEKYLTERLKGN